MKKIVLSVLALVATFTAFAVDSVPLSVEMVRSEMKRCPTAADLDFMQGRLKWNYTVGLELKAMLDVQRRYDEPLIVEYVTQWADTMINEKGEILTYRQTNYNLDHICPGQILFPLYQLTGQEKYRRAMRTLRRQLAEQPRTSEGGFWHKKIYPDQMWLDGLYMSSPFYARYAAQKEKGEQQRASYRDVVNQYLTVARHTYDPATSLYRHAWDESRSQSWADPATGQSAHAWGRAVGWYMMGMVEVLDWIPAKTEGRDSMIAILNNTYCALDNYRDSLSGMWYQVLDCPGREGNYVEATASAMITYAMLKAVRKGYLPRTMQAAAEDNYLKLVKRFIRRESDGTISLTDCCAVAGLGGKDNRSGTYDYYLSEQVRDNDPKGIGPFIWASLEYEALHKIEYTPEGWESQPVAFKGAEGGGMYARGGRGGRVIYVTKLTDDGSEGTLRWAVEQKGPRTVLFAVDGTIRLTEELEIRNGRLTIAGQSAPLGGVCIADNQVSIEADDVILRYLRFRLGDRTASQSDAVDGVECSNVIVDHCSISWSEDECASFYANRNFTMQWCIISEALNSSTHKKGDHGYGGIWGGRNSSFHHNLLASNNSRNPRLDHAALYGDDRALYFRGAVELVNNVVWNWGMKPAYGGEEGCWNFSGNYYKPGPASHRGNKFLEISVSKTTSMTPGRFWIDGNVLEGTNEVEKDNWTGVDLRNGCLRETVDAVEPFDVRGRLTREPARKAYRRVLAEAGASLWRDSVDARIVREVANGKPSYKGSIGDKAGIIDSQEDVGSWPRLASGIFLVDSDGDGIPDYWERIKGLDVDSAADGAVCSLQKNYTNLEVYLQWLIDK